MISSEISSPPKDFDNWIYQRLLANDGSSAEIDVLIGNDYYYNVMKEDKIQINEILFLVNSEFGWIVSGKLDLSPTDRHTLSVVTYFKTRIDMKLNPPDPPLDQGDIDLSVGV